MIRKLQCDCQNCCGTLRYDCSSSSGCEAALLTSDIVFSGGLSTQEAGEICQETRRHH